MASTIKVDNVQNQPGTNIIDKCGTTITIGQSGDTINLASGASQTGFGRTGTVDWVTTPKTATFTAVNGEGYFCNTGGGGFEMDLPAGSAGAIVSVQDYNNTFDTSNLTVDPNGSEKINGGAAGAIVTLRTEGLGITFVYIDSTVGWRSVQSNEYSTSGLTPSFIAATVSGACNTLTTVCTDYKLATFTGPGTFCVSGAGNPAGSNTVSYMVVAGGGGGGGTSPGGGPYSSGGGGGAGGFREGKSTFCGHTESPLATTGLSVSVQGYPIDVGGGGPGGPGTNNGTVGVNSAFSTITSAGGGFGNYRGANASAGDGGSGGGGAGNTPDPAGFVNGTGNTPVQSPPQGSDGGLGSPGPGGYPVTGANGGGGGGATAVGVAGSKPGGGPGGAGATTSISGAAVARAGGGGGGVYVCGGCFGAAGSGTGTGGGGPGGPGPASTSPGAGQTGTIITGGGGGGGSTVAPDNTARGGGAGGSGIVLIRYKFQ